MTVVTVSQVHSDQQPEWVRAYRSAVGEHLRAWRLYRGRTQIDMCHATGVDRTTYQRWEAGLSDPRLGELALLATELGTTVPALVDVDRAPGEGPAAGAAVASGGS